jgi:hypothetical protein
METPSFSGLGDNNNALINQPFDYSIPVYNDGLIAAEGVTITGYIVELNISFTSLPITILAESNESITLLFDTTEVKAGDYKITFTIDAGSTPLNENPVPVEMTQKFTADAKASSTNIVPIIIVIIFAIGIYSFVRSRRKGSGPGF